MCTFNITITITTHFPTPTQLKYDNLIHDDDSIRCHNFLRFHEWNIIFFNIQRNIKYKKKSLEIKNEISRISLSAYTLIVLFTLLLSNQKMFEICALLCNNISSFKILVTNRFFIKINLTTWQQQENENFRFNLYHSLSESYIFLLQSVNLRVRVLIYCWENH